MFRRSLLVALVAVAILLAPQGAVFATEGEPAPPELCNLPPRTLDAIVAFSQEPAPPEPDRPQLSDPFTVPDGDEVGTRTRLEIKKDLRRAIGCLNTGSLLSSLAAFTDSYVQRLILSLGGSVTDEVAQALTATTTRADKEYITIIDFQEMIVMPDDSVMAVVYGDDPLDDQPASYTVFYMVEVERGRWLIDGFQPVTREGTPTS